MMKAISERLDELVSAAERIRALIDDPARPPPGLLLCRAAVDIDAAAAKLADHAALLDAATRPPGERGRVK